MRQTLRAAWPAALTLTVVLSVASLGYGWHRDELYFRMLPPAWGYVDQPPFTPLLVKAAIAVFGDSVWALRLPFALIIGVVAVVGALVAREVGGGTGAQVVAAAGAGGMGPLLGGHLGSTTGPDLLVWALVGLSTVAAFAPTLVNGFVAWDDHENFLHNPHYRGLGLHQLRWMVTTALLGNYVPVTWLTLGLDYLLWGLDPRGYHLTSLLIHAANAILLFHLACRLLARATRLRGRHLWLAAIVIYVRGTQPHGRAGRYGFWPMILVLTVLWLTSLRGDPPPSLSALAVINTVFFAVVLAWAAWMTRARPSLFRRES